MHYIYNLILICIHDLNMHNAQREKREEECDKSCYVFWGFLDHNLPPLVNNFLRKRYKMNITSK